MRIDETNPNDWKWVKVNEDVIYLINPKACVRHGPYKKSMPYLIRFFRYKTPRLWIFNSWDRYANVLNNLYKKDTEPIPLTSKHMELGRVFTFDSTRYPEWMLEKKPFKIFPGDLSNAEIMKYLHEIDMDGLRQRYPEMEFVPNRDFILKGILGNYEYDSLLTEI